MEPDPTPEHERLPLDARIMIIILLTVLSAGGVALGYRLITLIFG
jgi:hypothetical protein